MIEYTLTNDSYILKDLPNMTKVSEKNNSTVYYIIHHYENIDRKVLLLRLLINNKEQAIRMRSQVHENYELFSRSCIIEPMTLSDIFLVRQYCESYKLPFGKWVPEASS